MSPTVISVLLAVHLTFITIWVGSQVMTAAAAVPAIRAIPDDLTRLDAMLRFTRRFNALAWIAMLGIVLTGGLLVGERIDDIKAFNDSIYDVRWGYLFSIKVALWAAMIGAVALHSFVVGPRMLDIQRRVIEHAEQDAVEARRLQRRSILLSSVGLVLSLLVLAGGAFLGNADFSLADA